MTVNVLSMQERVRVVSALVEGTSLRATERLTGVFRQAITGLLLCVGEGCRWLLDATMRDLHCDVLELDEVWAFVGKKEGHLTPDDPEEYGDQYTWIALDARTKLVPVHRVEKRTPAAAKASSQRHLSAVARVGLDSPRSMSCRVRADTPHTLAYSAMVRRKVVRILRTTAGTGKVGSAASSSKSALRSSICSMALRGLKRLSIQSAFGLMAAQSIRAGEFCKTASIEIERKIFISTL